MERLEKLFTQLIDNLRKLEKHRKLSIEQDELIKRSIEWLKNHQHPDGYWGYESVADTSLVLLALSMYDVQEQSWKIKNKHEGGVQRSINWLKSIRIIDNWDNNVWDTSICIQAIYRLGIREDWVFKSAEWVKNVASRRFDKLSYHHIAQAINMLIEIGNTDEAFELASRLEARLKTLLEEAENHKFSLDIYVIGQVLDALVRAGVYLNSPVIDYCESEIIEFLQEEIKTGISEGSFQDMTMAFLGLASFLGGENDEMIDQCIAEIFKSPDRYKKDGSWYQDAKKTAFALIGLSKIKEVRKIDTFPQRIYKIISMYKKGIEEEINKLHNEYTKQIDKLRIGYLWLLTGSFSLFGIIFLWVTIGVGNYFVQIVSDIVFSTILFTSGAKVISSWNAAKKVTESVK
ncbi:MAG: hypothetical protein ACTSYD_00780 [Candidatus Heimdallarchaeaceae archaeon]